MATGADGRVLTAGGTAAGKVQRLSAEAVRVAGKDISWPEVLVAVLRSDARTFPPPNALRMTTGEILRGHVRSVSGGKVSLDFQGRRQVDLEQVWAIDLVPAPPGDPRKPRTLFRGKLRPLPGSLVWIDAERIAVDSPLGVLTVPRAPSRRYVLREPDVRPLSAGATEVHLVDGSVLRGGATFTDKGLRLEHATLGEVELTWPAVRALRRRGEGVSYLADLKPASVRTAPLLVEEDHDGLTAGPSRRSWAVNEVRLEAGTAARYRPSSGDKGVLAATVAADPRSPRPVKLRILVGGKVLLEKTIDPADGPEPIRVKLPSADELTIEADFGPKVRLPSAVILGDPRVE